MSAADLKPLTADAMALELAGDRIASLEHDLVAYREIAFEAIHRLHDLTKQNDRLRAQLREMRSARLVASQEAA